MTVARGLCHLMSDAAEPDRSRSKPSMAPEKTEIASRAQVSIRDYRAAPSLEGAATGTNFDFGPPLANAAR